MSNIKWERLKIYRSIMEINGMIYSVVCQEEDEGYSLLVNGEYLKDIPELPTPQEVEVAIREEHQINYEASNAMSIQSRNAAYNGL